MAGSFRRAGSGRGPEPGPEARGREGTGSASTVRVQGWRPEGQGTMRHCLRRMLDGGRLVNRARGGNPGRRLPRAGTRRAHVIRTAERPDHLGFRRPAPVGGLRPDRTRDRGGGPDRAVGRHPRGLERAPISATARTRASSRCPIPLSAGRRRDAACGGLRQRAARYITPSRFVRTRSFEIEDRAGHAVYGGIMQPRPRCSRPAPSSACCTMPTTCSPWARSSRPGR